MTFRAGDWVQVRSKQEILATLDKSGCLEGLPFMPQMFKYCGQTFRIFKVAHKTCDTVNGTGGRSLPGGIHLDLRCDGQAYGGCQAACLIFWKDAWLKPVSDAAAVADPEPAPPPRAATPMHGCLESDVVRATSITSDGEEAYQCQAVRLPYFTLLLPWWRLDQYIADYLLGNVNLRKIFNGLVYTVYTKGTRAYHPFLGRPGRWLYNRFQTFRGGTPYPRQRGHLPAGEAAPIVDLNLQPGELVRIKSYDEILSTVNFNYLNRGLFFDAEMVPYCGGTYRVKMRVTKFIDEKTGKMKYMKTPALILEDVWCGSCFSTKRMFCPRAIYSWWREAWLERVEEEPKTSPRPTLVAKTTANA